MKILVGDTTQYKGDHGDRWAKADVELDETDLLRLLVENGSATPAEDSAKLPSAVAFGVLEAQATALVLVRLGTRLPELYGNDETKAEISKLLTGVKKKLGPYLTRLQDVGDDSDI